MTIDDRQILSAMRAESYSSPRRQDAIAVAALLTRLWNDGLAGTGWRRAGDRPWGSGHRTRARCRAVYGALSWLWRGSGGGGRNVPRRDRRGRGCPLSRNALRRLYRLRRADGRERRFGGDACFLKRRTAAGDKAICAVENSRNARGSGLGDASSRASRSRICAFTTR